MRDAALPFGARNTVPASVVYTQFVTVQAFPDIFVWSPVFAPLTVVVPVTANVGVALPDIATVLYFHAVMSPVVSAIVAALFCINLPVVLSNRAIALSVAEAGQTTSHDPQPAVKYSSAVAQAFTRICCKAVPIGSSDSTIRTSAGVNSDAVRAIF